MQMKLSFMLIYIRMESARCFRIEDSCEDSTRQIQMYGLFAAGNEAETQQLQISCACTEQHHNVAYIQSIGMILKVTWK